MRSKRRFFVPAMVGLIAVPMGIGFAGLDAASVSRSGLNWLTNIFAMRTAAAQDDESAFTAYREAMKVLKSEYYGDAITPKKNTELTIAAIRGMLYSLNDPFTSYLDREEWASMQQTTRGDFEGIGAELEQMPPDKGPIRVKRPIPETPAYHIGVKSGDLILSVGNYKGDKLTKTTSTAGKSINDIVKLIKGPAGTKVRITVLRKGETKPLVFTITRARVEPSTVRYWMEDNENKIGRIVLTEFNEKSDYQLDKAFAALEKQGMKALVFDLRYNPGGLLNVAVDVGSRFIEDGPVVIIQEKSGQRTNLNVRSSYRNRKKYPLAVLINENSASASEIVAGAIKDNKSGQLIGQHTFGKGLVQTLFPLTDNSALRLTTAKYFTSMGNDISNKYDDDHRPVFGTGGIVPDVEVKQSESWADQDFDDKKNDAQLQEALKLLRTRLASKR